MNIPPPLRDIASPHRLVLEHAFGPLRPVAGWVPPDVDFLFLCFTNRCGSNYLAHLLASTGAFNEAGEFFNAPTVLEHALPRGMRSLQEYMYLLPGLVAHQGRIAAKASADQLVMLADAGILDALGGRARYVLLERKDRLGQAISRAIAGQTGRWTTRHDGGTDAAVYDRGEIEMEMNKISHSNALLYLFFAANGIAPLHTTYEEIVAAPAAIVADLAARLGLAGLRVRPEMIGIGRQAGVVNEAWRRRFLEGK